MLQFWARFLTEADRTLWRTTPWGTQWGQLDDLLGLFSLTEEGPYRSVGDFGSGPSGITTSIHFGGLS